MVVDTTTNRDRDCDGTSDVFAGDVRARDSFATNPSVTMRFFGQANFSVLFIPVVSQSEGSKR